MRAQDPQGVIVDADDCQCGGKPDLVADSGGWHVTCSTYDGPEHTCYHAFGHSPSEAVDDWNRYQREEEWP